MVQILPLALGVYTYFKVKNYLRRKELKRIEMDTFRRLYQQNPEAFVKMFNLEEDFKRINNKNK